MLFRKAILLILKTVQSIYIKSVSKTRNFQMLKYIVHIVNYSA